MSDFITIAETNPIHLMAAFEKAVREGYFLDNTNAGYPMFSSVLKTVTLYKNPTCGVKRVSMPVEEITCEEYDPFAFLMQVQNGVLESFGIDYDTLYFESLKSVKMKKKDCIGKVEVPKELVQAVKPDVEPYTDKDLKAMSYNQLKELAEQLGPNVFNRGKAVMLKNIRKALDERFKKEANVNEEE